MPLRCRLRFLFANLFYEEEATNDIYIWSGFAMLNSVRTGLPDIFQDSFSEHIFPGKDSHANMTNMLVKIFKNNP